MKAYSQRKEVFSGKLLKLYLEKRRFPKGNIVNLEVIKHPGAVLIVPLLKKDKVVLIRQYRPVINSHIWELPAGTLDKGEKPLLCAKRELVEETGYNARRWKKLGYIYPAPGYTNEKITIFEAKAMEKVSSQPEDDEYIISKIFTKRGIGRLFSSGKITDAKTIAALKMARVL